MPAASEDGERPRREGCIEGLIEVKGTHMTLATDTILP
jgi:hypothetical protein